MRRALAKKLTNRDSKILLSKVSRKKSVAIEEIRAKLPQKNNRVAQNFLGAAKIKSREIQGQAPSKVE